MESNKIDLTELNFSELIEILLNHYNSTSSKKSSSWTTKSLPS